MRTIASPAEARVRAAELLDVAEAEAWRGYLAVTRDRGHHRYVEVEEWAWERLSDRLRQIQARRERLEQ